MLAPRNDERAIDHGERATAYARQDREHYKSICEGMCRALFDRDTAPGAEPEDLMRLDIPALVVPGHDASHATSAARYLEECLPRSDYWDVPVEQQDEDATNARVWRFCGRSEHDPEKWKPVFR